jgi:hypothetical protein
MAEYLPLHDDGDSITRAASAAITGGQLVVVSGSGTVGPSSAASASWLGVARFRRRLRRQRHRLHQRRPAHPRVGDRHRRTARRGRRGGAVATHTNGTADYNVVGLALTTATGPTLVEVKLTR